MPSSTEPTSSTTITGLRLKFPGESSLVFKDLSFEVPYGQKVLLLGPSGCGKSTLLQVLSGIIPHSIEVPLTYEKCQLPTNWGFVFQDPDTQFCMPYVDEELAFVLENLCIPREQMETRMRIALDQVGLQLDVLHTPIRTLSQGMKQRLALATALLLKPDVLFLDEPSALLDPEGTQQIWQAVKNIASSCTLLIVEHKIDQVIDLVDRVVLFDHQGNIIADDTPHRVFHQHKNKLIEYGIWYPNVWQDYICTKEYRTAMLRKQKQRHAADSLSVFTVPILSLQRFSGYYKQEPAITVPEVYVGAGEWIAIIGENGSGKSTLLLSLMQLLHTTGSYLIGGRPLPKPKKRFWSNKLQQQSPAELAFVFQNPEMQFITDSVYDEIAFELRSAHLDVTELERKVADILTAFHLDVGFKRHPYHLSLGQKRRLSIASAMGRVHPAPVLLLDEPTFGQDARNTFMILQQLEALRSTGTTIIMVTHDLNIVEHYADRIWQIENGLLTESNIPAAVNLELEVLLT